MSLSPRLRRWLSAGFALFIAAASGAFDARAQNTVQPGQVLISELRLRGPAGSADEFIELYNNTDREIVVQSSDGSPGWAVATAFTVPGGIANGPVFVIPNGTRIPARGHLLGANANGYSLGGYPSGDPAPDPPSPPTGEPDVATLDVAPFSTATPDITWDIDIPDGAGVALFTTTNTLQQRDPANRLDSFGFTQSPAIFREGDGWPTVPTSPREASFFRRQPGGIPQDTNDNAADFLYAGTSQDISGGLLGAPGPENLLSPVLGSGIRTNLLDPAFTAAQAPNRERRPTVIPNGDLGTLIIRRTFTNDTGHEVSRLRFRVYDITTLGNENSCGTSARCADVRAVTSPDGESAVGGQVVQVRGVRLEEPPAQPLGGGFNSSLSADFITLATPLKPGESVHIQFVLGVMRSGTFRYLVNIEASVNAPVIILPVGTLPADN